MHDCLLLASHEVTGYKFLGELSQSKVGQIIKHCKLFTFPVQEEEYIIASGISFFFVLVETFRPLPPKLRRQAG